jgi:hypothetical protein
MERQSRQVRAKTFAIFTCKYPHYVVALFLAKSIRSSRVFSNERECCTFFLAALIVVPPQSS